MDTTHDGSEYTRPVDRAEAARLLADAESGTPITSGRDLRSWAALTAGVGLVMGVFVTLNAVSPLFLVPYVLVLTGLVVWQRRTTRSTPLGAGRLYTVGIAVSSVLLVAVYVCFPLVWDEVDSIPLVAWVLAGLAIAAPMLVAAALIARKAGR